MATKISIREVERLRYEVPVEIRWLDAERQYHTIHGITEDVSIYGVRVSVPFQVPAGQELTITLDGVAVCGGAVLIHSQRCSSGFRVGLYFKLTLLMQNIPGLDELLQPSLLNRSVRNPSVLTAFVQRLGLGSGVHPSVPSSKLQLAIFRISPRSTSKVIQVRNWSSRSSL